VLALSLGQSAVYSVVSIIDRLTADTPLRNQSATINGSQSTREWLDFTYQFLDIAFSLAAVALVIYLLWTPAVSGFRRVGLDLGRFGRDSLGGLALVLLIGVPGIGLYVVGRLAGVTVAVVASPLDTHWWTIPILILSAVRSGLQEEVIVVGYLFRRLRELGWSRWTMIAASAVLRGTYHLYQGIGPFVGNVVMGIVFGWCYARWAHAAGSGRRETSTGRAGGEGRVMPLVIAHAIIDIASFVGYPLAVAWWPALFAAH
jgi:CAAX amino terminal protease family.